MALEDFFTLTEMKDGLTAPGRVEELVIVMQKEKDYVVKNIGEATRQWSTVANTIASTENKECLDLFIQLNGLWFFNRWLRDAQKFCNDTSDSFVEESINAVLRALERLHIENEMLFSSGIWITVKNLLSHNSSKVQDSTRALFESWKWVKDSDVIYQADKDVEIGASHEDGSAGITELDKESVMTSSDATYSKESANEVSLLEDVKDASLIINSLDGLQIREKTDLQVEISNIKVNILDHSEINHSTPEASSSTAALNLVQDHLFIKEDPIVCLERNVSTKTNSSPVIEQASSDSNQTNKNVSSSEGPVTDVFSSSFAMEAGPLRLRDDAGESMNELTLQTNNHAKDCDSCVKSTSHDDVGTLLSEPKNGMDKCLIPFRGALVETSHDDVGTLLSEPKNGMDKGLIPCRGGMAETAEITFSGKEDMDRVENDEELASEEEEDMTDASEIVNRDIYSKASDVFAKSSDIDIEYGIFDALEVARQVANAVEREVVGQYMKPFCDSSSDKVSEGPTEQPGSPESINEKNKGSSESTQNVTSTGKSVDTNSINSDNPNNEPDNCMHYNKSSQMSETAQVPEGNTKKGICDFDLNEEIEDLDHPLNPVSVVSALRATAVPGLPGAPLQFEGTLGWKGSALTSAFRPASSRTMTTGSPKQRHDVLEFDLNVTESEDDKNGDLISPGLLSGESFVEVAPRPSRSDGLKLDLNFTDDDHDHQNPSPASSSSTVQPFFRNIDLNDRPSTHHDSSDQLPHFLKSSSSHENAYGMLKPVDRVISIFGTRVEVNRKDHVAQFMSLSNGKAPEPAAMDVNIGRITNFQPTMSSYAHSPAYGYNGGHTNGPSISFYAPGSSFPYMVDSRGAPIASQIMGYAPGPMPSYPQQQQFITNMNGSLQANYDLSSGFMSEVGNNRDAGGTRQLFLHGQGRTMEEHLRPSSSSGIVGGRRKEPDGGWELFPLNPKHHQPPWK